MGVKEYEAMEDLCLLVYLHNKLQQADKEAEVSTWIIVDVIKRKPNINFKGTWSYTINFGFDV